MCKDINTFISKIYGISTDIRKRRMSNPIVNDFVVTLYFFNTVVKSKLIKKHSMEELKNLIDVRCVHNKGYFEKNQLIISYYKF